MEHEPPAVSRDGESVPDVTIDTHGKGKYTPARVGAWLGVYVALALVPLGIAMAGPLPPPRPFVIELGVGLGFLGAAILAVQFLTSGRFIRVAPAFGADILLQFHRQAGILGFVLVAIHPVMLIIGDPVYLEFFDPRVNFLRAIALGGLVPILVALMSTSLWRERFGLSYERWRAAHGGLSLLVVFIGMVHGLQVGHYLEDPLRRGLWVGVLAGSMYLVVHSRLVRPWLLRRRPYEVVKVSTEGGDVHTMELRAVGHAGLSFQAGQYAWITLGDSPFSMQQHPFSFASSAEADTIEFSAKAVGDFTSTWPDVADGTTAYLEGPFGAFTLDPGARGAVMIVGGIGVTPAMSLLRTARDRRDSRPFTLIYANPSWDEVAFADEITALHEELDDLAVIHVLEDPPEGWAGPSGFVDEAMLDETLDDEKLGFDYFVCGPEPMMDSVETALRALGVPRRRIYTERFQIV
jgi:predicted ferric reductase